MLAACAAHSAPFPLRRSHQHIALHHGLLWLTEAAALALQEVSLTSKYDHTHHSLPEPLLGLASLKSLAVRFPSLTSLQSGLSRLTNLERLRVEGLQGTLILDPGRKNPSCPLKHSCCPPLVLCTPMSDDFVWRAGGHTSLDVACSLLF